MKTRTLMAVVSAVTIAFGGLAVAKDKEKGGDHDNRYKTKHSKYDQREDQRGAGPDHNFYKGSRLPVYYRDRSYWVNDWRGHRLSAPPPGYHWVQTGGDYVLVANSSNIIFQINLGG